MNKPSLIDNNLTELASIAGGIRMAKTIGRGGLHFAKNPKDLPAAYRLYRAKGTKAKLKHLITNPKDAPAIARFVKNESKAGGKKVKRKISAKTTEYKKKIKRNKKSIGAAAAGAAAGGAAGYLMEELAERVANLHELAAIKGLSAARRLRHLKLKANRKLKGREISPQARLHMQNVGEAKGSWFGKDMKTGDVVRKQKQIRKADQQAQNKSNKLVIGAGVIPPVLATGASVAATSHYAKKYK